MNRTARTKYEALKRKERCWIALFVIGAPITVWSAAVRWFPLTVGGLAAFFLGLYMSDRAFKRALFWEGQAYIEERARGVNAK